MSHKRRTLLPLFTDEERGQKEPHQRTERAPTSPFSGRPNEGFVPARTGISTHLGVRICETLGHSHALGFSVYSSARQK